MAALKILRRSSARAVAALALLAALVTPASAIASDRTIIAIGDLHGDYSAWLAIARDSHIVDASGHWNGGRAVLVQLGDITDRGPDSLKIITDLRRLQKEAAKAGGKVIVMLGNHEAMNVIGDLRYTDAGEFAAFATPQSTLLRDSAYAANKARIEARARAANPSASPAAIREQWIKETPLGWVEHRKAWAPGGDLGRWARSNPAVVKIDGTLFVHGGISAEYAARSVESVNRRIAEAMASADDSPSSPLTDPLGPLWYRGLVIRDADAEAARAQAKQKTLPPEQEVEAVLKAYGAKRIVVGHTPSLKGILILMNGKLVRADTGDSRYYGGQLSWLEINGDRVVAHAVARPGQ